MQETMLMANALDALIDRIPDEALRGQIREALKSRTSRRNLAWFLKIIFRNPRCSMMCL